jgi:hypothetical protein
VTCFCLQCPSRMIIPIGMLWPVTFKWQIGKQTRPGPHSGQVAHSLDSWPPFWNPGAKPLFFNISPRGKGGLRCIWAYPNPTETRYTFRFHEKWMNMLPCTKLAPNPVALLSCSCCSASSWDFAKGGTGGNLQHLLSQEDGNNRMA